jgi:hypothetical protein
MTGNLLRMRSYDEMHTAGIFLSSLRPAVVNAFSPDPGVRYPHPMPRLAACVS